MANADLPRIEVQTKKKDPQVEELEDQIADLLARAFYSYILQKGLLKRGRNALDSTPSPFYDGVDTDKSLLRGE